MFVCITVFITGFYYDIRPQWQELDKLQEKERQLKLTFENRQKKIVNFVTYKNQYFEVERQLANMLKKLPNKSEVADLLIEVSQVGLHSGLKFKLFKPMPGQEKDFYKELPIQIKMVGDYKQFAVFISGLAGLSRIVTIHDINIESSSASLLTMSAMLKTYSEPQAKKGLQDKRKQ
jgi:type IV pilus assembly protein PilO